MGQAAAPAAALDHLRQRQTGNEAQVQRAGHRQVRLGLELPAALHVQVDLLVAELEGLALHRRRAADEAFQGHAQHAGVEVHAGGLVKGRQYQVVQSQPAFSPGTGGQNNHPTSWSLLASRSCRSVPHSLLIQAPDAGR
jgi:hypothetical protein